jgi:hypothetical protein
MAITALASLIAGGSLGPEAPLADACGGLGTLLSDGLKLDETGTRSLGFSGIGGMLGALVTSPFGGALLVRLNDGTYRDAPRGTRNRACSNGVSDPDGVVVMHGLTAST